MTIRGVKGVHSNWHGGNQGKRPRPCLSLVHTEGGIHPHSALAYPQGILPWHLHMPWVWRGPHHSRKILRLAQCNTSITITKTPPNPQAEGKRYYSETLSQNSFHSNFLSPKGLRGSNGETHCQNSSSHMIQRN